MGVIFIQEYTFSKDLHSSNSSNFSEYRGANTLFIENKGQIGDQHGRPNLEVKYLICRPGLNIQLKANSFSYDAYQVKYLQKADNLSPLNGCKNQDQRQDSIVYNYHRVDLEFLGANPSPEILNEGVSEDFLNYYTHVTYQTNGENGVTGIRGYSKIIYKNIYSNIDLEWIINEQGAPEYHLIVQPGGRLADIKIRYHGADVVQDTNDKLLILTSLGVIEESIPISYLLDKKNKVDVSYESLDSNTYTFSSNQHFADVLTIDPLPTIKYFSYRGGTQPDVGNSIAVDNMDGVFVCGSTESNMIASTNTFQTTYGGNSDVIIYKLKKQDPGYGSWCTYAGNFNLDYGNGIAIDKNGDIWITGQTSGSGTVWGTSFKGGRDIILAKFKSTDGQRKLRTLLGGTGVDIGNSICIDTKGNILIIGETSSMYDISTEKTANQKLIGGEVDGFIMKLDTNTEVIWSTYVGGSDIDKCTSIAVDSLDNYWVIGNTNSLDSISTVGAWQFEKRSTGSYTDVFISKYKENGTLLWSTYYGGSRADSGFSVAVDKNYNGWIVGKSQNAIADTVLGSENSWQRSMTPGIDAFVAKFSSLGERIWGTYLGGAGSETAKGVSIDPYGNGWVIGQTNTTTNFSTIGSAQQLYAGGPSDVMINKFTPKGQRLWMTYLGGNSSFGATPSTYDGADIGNCIVYDKSDLVFVSGRTGSQNLMYNGHPGAGGFLGDSFVASYIDESNQLYITKFPKRICKDQLVKVDFKLFGNIDSNNIIGIWLSDSLGSFNKQTLLASENKYVSGNVEFTIPDSITPGNKYRIKVENSTPVYDTSYNIFDVDIIDLAPPTVIGKSSICIDQGIEIYSVPKVKGYKYKWNGISNGVIVGDTTNNELKISWNNPGIDTFNIIVIDTLTGCQSESNFVVNTHKINTTSEITGTNTFCLNDTTPVYKIDIQPNCTYNWSIKGKGSIVEGDSANIISILWSEVGIDTIVVSVNDTNTSCNYSVSKVVSVNKLNTVSISGPSDVCTSNEIREYYIKCQDSVQVNWYGVKNGDILGRQDANSLSLRWKIQGKDTLRLSIINKINNCTLDTFYVVHVNQVPTPQIDGKLTVSAATVNEVYSIKRQPGSSYLWSIESGPGKIVSNLGSAVLISFTSVGKVILKVIETDLNGCSEYDQIIVNVENVSDITENDYNDMFTITPTQLYPSDLLQITTKTKLFSEVEIDVYDQTGQLIVRTCIENGTDRKSIKIDDFTPGVYWVRFVYYDRYYVKKIVVM
jgi:hypothetical protein